MNAFRTILCATSLSDADDESLRQAHTLAREYGARLIVFHAMPNVMRSAPLFPHLALADNSQFVELERRVIDAMGARVGKLTGRADAEFQLELGFGAPHTAVLEAAERLAADLVVVGDAATHGAARTLLGSTAERVVRHAHCAVWVARPGFTTGRVLIATDFSEPALPAVERGLEYAQRSASPVAVMYGLAVENVLAAPAASPAEMPAFPVWTSQEVQEMRDESAKRLREALARFGAEGEVLVDDRRPATAIIEAAERIKARLICIGTRGRTGLARVAMGSVAEEVVRNANCPVLVCRLAS